MTEPKAVDPKAWVRQYIAIIMCVYVFAMSVMVATGLVVVSLVEAGALITPGWGIIGWFFRARDIEKKQISKGL